MELHAPAYPAVLISRQLQNLPPMRHVEMAFTYDKSSVVTERTPIPLPEVEPVIHATYILVDDQPDGLIIDMDEFDCTCTM